MQRDLHNEKIVNSLILKISGIEFQDPFNINMLFKPLAGIYVIYDHNIYLDVGETDNLGQEISTHEKKTYWVNNTLGLCPVLAFHYCESKEERLKIKSELEETLDPCFVPYKF